MSTVSPYATRPHGTRISLGQNFKKGLKNFEISDFGTGTSLEHDFEKNSIESQSALFKMRTSALL